MATLSVRIDFFNGILLLVLVETYFTLHEISEINVRSLSVAVSIQSRDLVEFVIINDGCRSTVEH